MAAGKAIFSLKSDEASLQDRYSTQDRHLNVIMSSLAEEITAIKAAKEEAAKKKKHEENQRALARAQAKAIYEGVSLNFL